MRIMIAAVVAAAAELAADERVHRVVVLPAHREALVRQLRGQQQIHLGARGGEQSG